MIVAGKQTDRRHLDKNNRLSFNKCRKQQAEFSGYSAKDSGEFKDSGQKIKRGYPLYKEEKMTTEEKKVCPTCQGKKIIGGVCEGSSEWSGAGGGDDFVDRKA